MLRVIPSRTGAAFKNIYDLASGCVDTICSSDHKPVFSSFDVAIVNQFTAAIGGKSLSGDVKIAFEEISAEVCSYELLTCRGSWTTGIIYVV
jgi:hypothetical protein